MKLSSKCAVAALGMIFSLMSVISKATEPAQQKIKLIRADPCLASKGSLPNFSGAVSVTGRFQSEPPALVGGATVTFEPAARTAWHAHPLGQTLVIMSGHGFVQEWGKTASAFSKGDVVWIPPNIKHWHGAAPNEAMTHVAVAEKLGDRTVTWMEPVTDTQYSNAISHQP